MLIFKLCFLFGIFTSLCYSLNNRPIIGIIAQNFHQQLPPGVNGTSYISAAYVKFLETAGARVVPITINMTTEHIAEVFSYINGILFPGGDVDLMNSPYRKNAEIMYNLAMHANDAGDYFPIWGTCLGLQALCVITTKTDNIISKSVGTWDSSVPLNFTKAPRDSRMFNDAPINVLNILQYDNVTFNAHRNCVLSETFFQNDKLNNFFTVLSSNNDAEGNAFVSTIEGKNYPFYAVQWHPEMNIFEFGSAEGLGTHINHSKDAVYISQYMANFFVNEARKSNHRFPDALIEEKYLIYNYPVFHSGPYGWIEEQIYIF